MRKDELNPRQMGERAALVISLLEAGWQETAINRLFDHGKLTPAEAQLQYQNTQLLLTVTYFAEAGRLYLSLRDPEGGPGVAVATVFGERMAEWLNAIKARQETASPENFRETLEALLMLFPDTALELEVEGTLILIPLSDPLTQRLLAAPWDALIGRNYGPYLTPEDQARLEGLAFPG